MTTYVAHFGSGYKFEEGFVLAYTDDVHYYCGPLCMKEDLKKYGIVGEELSGEFISDSPMLYTDGSSTDKYFSVEWSDGGSESETNCDVYCETCKDFLWEGLQNISSFHNPDAI